MLIAMIAGILAGLLFMAVRENAGAAVWTTLNVTGDSLTSVAVAKSEGKLNVDVFNKK